MTIKYYENLEQGSEEWLQARCGLLTASEVKLIITPNNLQFAKNDKCRAHVHELVSQRITQYVEPHYVSDDMVRGQNDEVEALHIYSQNYGEIKEIGFITNDNHGFTLGYSPDGAVVGEKGGVEVKSRRQKYQAETIICDEMPIEYALQCQTGLIVTEWEWIDFISYCGGMPMYKKRIYPDEAMQKAIIKAGLELEELIQEKIERYNQNSRHLIPTERIIEQEMYI